ncbi:MAG: FkbM family methyltransferase [Candidatus Babeliales bacterium]|jgi:FkbM family methyltransferase
MKLKKYKVILNLIVVVLLSNSIHPKSKFSNQLPNDVVHAKTVDEIFALIMPILPINPIIIEAGAYDGSDSVKMAKFWPQGRVHSFEPVPELCLKVMKKTKDYRNISSYQYALSDKEGHADFYVSSFEKTPDAPSASSSLLKPAKHLDVCQNIIFKKKISVETTTIDVWAEKNRIDHVDFIWLDTQGSELSILKSSPNILKTVKAVFTEVEFIEAYKDQPLFKDVRKLMENNGFTLAAVRMYSWSADVLFVRQK